MPTLAIVYDLDAESRAIVDVALDGAAEAIFLPDLDDACRADTLRRADVVLARTTRELRPGEIALMKDIRLLQLINAGVDHVPLADLPPNVPVANNGGAYGEPMAEHVLAMALAAAKRLVVEHAALTRGEFNQFNRNRMLAGGVCGIFGFGGIGVATARLARGIGMEVHAINRRGRSDEPTEWIGTPDQLDTLLEAVGSSGDLLPAYPRHTEFDRCTAASAHEAGCDPGQCSTWRDHQRTRAVRTSGRDAGVHCLYRRVVGRAGAAGFVPHGPAVHDSAECHRFSA